MNTPLATLGWRDLQPGDVLLCRGSARLGSAISDWICALDSGRYSHAALWDGEAVLEASGGGGKIRAAELSQLLREHEYTHVYRPRPELGGQPGSWRPDPVLEFARSRLGAGYPYAELCLVGVLVGLGRTTGLPRMQELLRTSGAALARALGELKRSAHTELMTCSQLVSMAFWEADPSPSRRYALRVPYEPARIWRDADPCGLSREEHEQLQTLRLEWRKLLNAPHLTPRRWTRDVARGHRGERALGVGSMLVQAGSSELPSICVTPRDIERSPSLQCIGEVCA